MSPKRFWNLARDETSHEVFPYQQPERCPRRRRVLHVLEVLEHFRTMSGQELRCIYPEEEPVDRRRAGAGVLPRLCHGVMLSPAADARQRQDATGAPFLP